MAGFKPRYSGLELGDGGSELKRVQLLAPLDCRRAWVGGFMVTTTGRRKDVVRKRKRKPWGRGQLKYDP